METPITKSEEDIVDIIKGVRKCRKNISVNCIGMGTEQLFASKKVCLFCYKESIKITQQRQYEIKRMNKRGIVNIQTKPDVLQSMSPILYFD